MGQVSSKRKVDCNISAVLLKLHHVFVITDARKIIKNANKEQRI